jgi:hypothetical protein
MPAARAALPVVDGTPVPRLEFVEVTVRTAGVDGEVTSLPAEPRWSLWDDPGA